MGNDVSEMQFKKSLQEELHKHKNLESTVRNLITTLLDQENISYLEISGRVKTTESVLKKIERKRKEKENVKKYQEPLKALTDLTGIRITACFEKDVEKIRSLLEKTFEVDQENSKDTKEVLGKDRLGTGLCI